MNKILKNRVLKDLRPNGIWQLTDKIKSLLRLHISRLPTRKVSENETRYPECPASMKAFLIKFFTRHYFQTQNSMVTYMTSEDFLNIIRSKRLRILDIGSGPAVTPLAITDMLSRILKNLKESGEWPKRQIVNVDCVLNDTSGICLGTAQRMLTDYSKVCRSNNNGINIRRIISIQKAFPENYNQLRRIQFNIGTYDIVIFSYIAHALIEDKGFQRLIKGLRDIEKLCNRHGRIFILQDKFQDTLMKRISKAIGTSIHREESTQEVYPNRNTNETYTYSYYSCLYDPTQKAQGLSNVA